MELREQTKQVTIGRSVSIQQEGLLIAMANERLTERLSEASRSHGVWTPVSNRSPLFSLFSTNSSLSQDYCIALLFTSQAGVAEWGLYPSLNLIINTKAPPASSGDNVLQHAKWAFAQVITKHVRHKILKKSLKLRVTYCKQVCSSGYWPRTLKQTILPLWRVHLHIPETGPPGNNSDLHTTGLHVVVRAEWIYWGLHLSEVW